MQLLILKLCPEPDGAPTAPGARSQTPALPKGALHWACGPGCRCHNRKSRSTRCVPLGRTFENPPGFPNLAHPEAGVAAGEGLHHHSSPNPTHLSLSGMRDGPVQPRGSRSRLLALPYLPNRTHLVHDKAPTRGNRSRGTPRNRHQCRSAPRQGASAQRPPDRVPSMLRRSGARPRSVRWAASSAPFPSRLPQWSTP